MVLWTENPKDRNYCQKVPLAEGNWEPICWCAETGFPVTRVKPLQIFLNKLHKGMLQCVNVSWGYPCTWVLGEAPLQRCCGTEKGV